MAEKDTPTTHTEPMTTEMMAAVDANNSSDEKPAKKSVTKKKAAVKKKAAPKKKSSTRKKAAPKKSSVAKKKAAPKKKVAPKKKSAVKKKSAAKKSSVTKTAATATAVAAAAPKQTSDAVDNKPEPQPTQPTAKVTEKVATPSTPTETVVAATPEAVEAASVSSEEKQHQQQIRQKLVDLGVADADEIGAVAHEEPQESSGSFWIKAIIALLILVGLYFYSKSSNDLSSAQVTSQPIVAPLESHSTPLEKTTAAEVNSDEAALSESTTPEVLTTPNVNPNVVEVEADAATPAAQESDIQPSPTETTPVAENSGSDENTTTIPEAIATPEQMQRQYIPSYAYPNPWNPNYYPPFNTMNQMAPINPYSYPPINMAPGGMVPPPYYNYPVAPYQPPQLTPTE